MMDGADVIEKVGISYKEALNIVCQTFGISMREQGTTLCFFQEDNAGFDVGMTILSWGEFISAIDNAANTSVKSPFKLVACIPSLFIIMVRMTKFATTVTPCSPNANIILCILFFVRATSGHPSYLFFLCFHTWSFLLIRNAAAATGRSLNIFFLSAIRFSFPASLRW